MKTTDSESLLCLPCMAFCYLVWSCCFSRPWPCMASFDLAWHCVTSCGFVRPCVAFLWYHMALYGLLWQNIVFSRGHRSKFIWSCSHKCSNVIWMAGTAAGRVPTKIIFYLESFNFKASLTKWIISSVFKKHYDIVVWPQQQKVFQEVWRYR